MEYRISPLPYPCSALEPHIDAETMLIHHGHYYGSYTRDLNRIVSQHPELRGNNVQELMTHLAGVPVSIRDAVRHHAGGCLNHEIYFSLMRPRKNQSPEGRLAEAIRANFRDLVNFQRRFEQAALDVLGSGWVWLVCSANAREASNSAPRLRILTTQDHGNPLSMGLFPVLGADLWEHAYYHRYRNDRQAYLAAWWKVVDWQAVEERYLLAQRVRPVHEQPLLAPLRRDVLDLPAFRSIA